MSRDDPNSPTPANCFGERAFVRTLQLATCLCLRHVRLVRIATSDWHYDWHVVPRQTGTHCRGIMYSTRPSVHSSVTTFVTTIFKKKIEVILILTVLTQVVHRALKGMHETVNFGVRRSKV